MLPEAMYRSLQEGKLSEVYPTKTLLEIRAENIKALKRRKDHLQNVAVELVKPLALVKAVVVTGTKFAGYRAVSSNAYIGKYGDELSHQVDVKSQLVRPTVATLTHIVGENKHIVEVIFMPLAPYSHGMKKIVGNPEALKCSAAVTSASGLFRYDAVDETFNIGVFDDRHKPVGEYPVSGADNVVLDLVYSWGVKNTIYPTPVPPGLIFDSLSVELVSGFMKFEGKNYTDPSVNNKVRIRARIVNGTGATILLKHLGLPLSVVYEDNLRVSQINASVSFPDKTLGNGQTYSYYLDVNLPAWCYGKVGIAHAINVYKGGMYIYGGGPFYCFEVFRLRLP